MDPKKLKYSKSHEWVHLEGDEATVGISDFAVKQLTDLVYIELPPVGKSFSTGQEFGVVESVKARPGISPGEVGNWIGVMTAAYLIGAATGGVLFGWLGDRLG